MLPIYPGGHAAYQNFVVEQIRNHYANPADLPDTLLDIAERFPLLDYSVIRAILIGTLYKKGDYGMKQFVIIDEADDVLTVLQDSSPETQFVLQDGRVITLVDKVPSHHKVALHDIPQGQVVLRYGAPIGYATKPIRAGEWVHIHNLDAVNLM